MLPLSSKAVLALRLIPISLVAAAVAAVAFVAKADDAPSAASTTPAAQARTSQDRSWIEQALSAATSTSGPATEKKTLNEDDKKMLGQALAGFWRTSWQMAWPWSKTVAGAVGNFLGWASGQVPDLLAWAGISFQLAPTEQDPRLGAQAPVTPVLLQK